MSRNLNANLSNEDEGNVKDRRAAPDAAVQPRSCGDGRAALNFVRVGLRLRDVVGEGLGDPLRVTVIARRVALAERGT